METLFGWFPELCTVPSPRFSAGEDLTALDLIAQQQMACWTRWMTIVTGVSLVVSIFAISALVESLRQTRRAINDNRALGEAQTRAYVHASAARHAWTDTGYGLIVELINVGDTSATVFEVGGRIQKAQIGAVSKAIQHESYTMKRWSALGSKSSPTTVRLDLDENTEIVREFRKPVNGFVFLVTGTVRYQDVYQQWFETDFAFYSYTAETGSIDSLNKLRRPTANLRSYQPVPSPPDVAPEISKLVEVDPYEAPTGGGMG